jgi:hypothetical protein
VRSQNSRASGNDRVGACSWPRSVAVGAGISNLTSQVSYNGLGAFTSAIVHVIAGILAFAAMPRWLRLHRHEPTVGVEL